MIKLNKPEVFVYEWSHANPGSGFTDYTFSHPFGTNNISVKIYLKDRNIDISPVADFKHLLSDYNYNGQYEGGWYAFNATTVQARIGRIYNTGGTYTLRAEITKL